MVRRRRIAEKRQESVWGMVTKKEAERRIKQYKLLEEHKIDVIECKCLECSNLLKKICGFMGTFFSHNSSLKGTRFSALPEDKQKEFQVEIDSVKQKIFECQQNVPENLVIKPALLKDKGKARGRDVVKYITKKKKTVHQLEVDILINRITNMWNSITALEMTIRNEKAKQNKEKHQDKINSQKDKKEEQKKVVKDKIIKLVEVDMKKLVSGSHIPKFDSFCGDDEFSEEDRKNHQIIWLHRTRKIKDPTKSHATDREILLNLVSSWCDNSANPETFKLLPRISGNMKNRVKSVAESPNSVVLCCKCPVEECDQWIPVHGIVRRLFACPPHFKTKKGHTINPKMEGHYQRYIAKVRKLEQRINMIDYKKRREIRFQEALKKNPGVITCLYCDMGIAFPLDEELMRLEEYFHEQTHVRICDDCGVTFCCKKGKDNKMCGERYFAGEPYKVDKVDEKTDDPRIDHRKRSCREVQAIKDKDENMMEISKTSKECPRCGHAVIKIDGCDRMTCRCGQNFCWKCGQGFSGGDATYNHINKCVIKTSPQ